MRRPDNAPEILNRRSRTASAVPDSAARSWYVIKRPSDNAAAAAAAAAADPAQAPAETATRVDIYDEIGYWGVSAKDFVNELRALSGALDVHLNSPGGEVFDGVAIYQALKDHPGTVTVTVDSLAASAASFIAMAGDTIIMGRNAMMMIHNASGIAMGTASELRAYADLLDRVTSNIADVYAQKTGKPASTWLGAMADETWYSAQEAVDAGLADMVAPDPSASTGGTTDSLANDPLAHWDLSQLLAGVGARARYTLAATATPAASDHAPTAPTTPTPAPALAWDFAQLKGAIQEAVNHG